MVTQLRAMLLSTLSAELCVDEEESADSCEDTGELLWLWGEVLAIGDEAAGVIDW